MYWALRQAFYRANFTWRINGRIWTKAVDPHIAPKLHQLDGIQLDSFTASVNSHLPLGKGVQPFPSHTQAAI